jgi:hypothetical protein
MALEFAVFTEDNSPSYKDGFSLTMAQFAEAGVLSLGSLEEMAETEAKATLSHVPGRIMRAANRLGVFMRLNADHKVLQTLGLDVGDLTPAFIKNVLESDRQVKAIPEAFAKKFCRVVPSPSDSSIIHFMDSFTSILSDFGLAHMMTLTVDEVKSGKYHLAKRIISNLLIDKVRKTAVPYRLGEGEVVNYLIESMVMS